jgi:hypothetical protein
LHKDTITAEERIGEYNILKPFEKVQTAKRKINDLKMFGQGNDKTNANRS